MKLGAFTQTNHGETGQDASIRYEKLVGVEGAYTRSYIGFDQPWDGSFMKWGAQQEKINVIALHARVNSYDALQWQAIANGSEDTAIRLHCKELLSYPGHAYLIWHHEPENDCDEWFHLGPDQDAPSGDPADYRAAGAHVFEVIRQAGVGPNRATLGQCLMAGTYGRGHGGFVNWKIPSAEILAVDGYDRAVNLKQAKSFEEMFNPAHVVAQREHKPLFVEETGTIERGPGVKATWFRHAAACPWTELEGVEYSNVTAKANYEIDTSPGALTAYREWAKGADPVS